MEYDDLTKVFSLLSHLLIPAILNHSKTSRRGQKGILEENRKREQKVKRPESFLLERREKKYNMDYNRKRMISVITLIVI